MAVQMSKRYLYYSYNYVSSKLFFWIFPVTILHKIAYWDFEFQS